VGLQRLFKLSSSQPRPTCKCEYGRARYQNLSIVTFPTRCRKDSRLGLSCSALSQAPPVFEKCEDTDDIKNLISSMVMVNATDSLVQPLLAPPCFLEYCNLVSLWREPRSGTLVLSPILLKHSDSPSLESAVGPIKSRSFLLVYFDCQISHSHFIQRHHATPTQASLCLHRGSKCYLQLSFGNPSSP
jgi:hypothetical protein